MADKIQIRRDTAANWTAANTLLAQGEQGFEIDTGRLKVGDGSTSWNTLDYKFESTVVEAPAGTFTFTDELGAVTQWVIAAGGGENNTASNVGSGGVGIFKQKTAADLEFKNLNAGSSKVTITNDGANDEVDVDIVPGNIDTSGLNNDAGFIGEAPNDGSQYARQSLGWAVVTGGGGGVTDHGALTGLADDDHIQYLNLTRHNLIGSNPHGVTATDLGLGNVDNTSDVNKPVSLAAQNALNLKYDSSNPSNYIDAAGAPVQSADIANFETTTQLNSRDTNNRARANHTGSQLASTISDFAATVRATVLTSISFATSTAVTAADSILVAIGKLQAQITATNAAAATKVFGDEAEDFLNNTNINITTLSPILAKSFTTLSKPVGRYRIRLTAQLEAGSPSANDLMSLRIDGAQIDLEYENEGKDSGSDIRNLIVFVGYYDNASVKSFDIELWSGRESGTQVIHGASAEVWRVS